MRVSGAWVGWSVALVLGCSGGDMESDTDRTGGPVQGAMAGVDGAGAGGTSGPGDFGNAGGSAPVVRPPPMSMADGGTNTDGGPCLEGQFCGPSGPDGNCGSIRFESDVEVTRTPGNLLIIFDQSGSMEQPWQAAGTTKMEAAKSALVAAITPLQEEVTVGAVFLPTATCFDPAFEASVQLAMLLGQPVPQPPAGLAIYGNAVPAIDDPSQINFMPGPAFLQAWNDHWTNHFVSNQLLGTPLQEGFDRAAEAINAARQNMTLAGTGQVAIVAFTDGEPNCFPMESVTGRPTLDAAARATEWFGMNIKTHVVGLPGANEGMATLNGIAQSGGTTQYLDPANPAELEARLREVVLETVDMGFNSCTIALDPVPEVPDDLLMIVDEPMVGKQQVPRDRGWELSADGTVAISGGLCDDAMAGRFSSITFEYACPEVPPPPPLPPIE